MRECKNELASGQGHYVFHPKAVKKIRSRERQATN